MNKKHEDIYDYSDETGNEEPSDEHSGENCSKILKDQKLKCIASDSSSITLEWEGLWCYCLYLVYVSKTPIKTLEQMMKVHYLDNVAQVYSRQHDLIKGDDPYIHPIGGHFICPGNTYYCNVLAKIDNSRAKTSWTEAVYAMIKVNVPPRPEYPTSGNVLELVEI